MNEDHAPRIQRLPSGPEREAFLPLLLPADEPEPLRAYLQAGDLFVLWAKVKDYREPLGVTHVMPVPEEPGTGELRAVAIARRRHNRGLGQKMLAGVLHHLRRQGARRVIVGASNAGIGQIAFYQKAGFRLWRIERDYFTPEKGTPPTSARTGSLTATWSGSTRTGLPIADSR